MKVPANLVPAAAVIRGGPVLFGVIRRKEFEDCLNKKIIIYFLYILKKNLIIFQTLRFLK